METPLITCTLQHPLSSCQAEMPVEMSAHSTDLLAHFWQICDWIGEGDAQCYVDEQKCIIIYCFYYYWWMFKIFMTISGIFTVIVIIIDLSTKSKRRYISPDSIIHDTSIPPDSDWMPGHQGRPIDDENCLREGQGDGGSDVSPTSSDVAHHVSWQSMDRIRGGQLLRWEAILWRWWPSLVIINCDMSSHVTRLKGLKFKTCGKRPKSDS